MQNIYPYTDLHELNLDWVLQQIKLQDNRIKNLETMVPPVPATAGTYKLTAVVHADGTIDYSWEV